MKLVNIKEYKMKAIIEVLILKTKLSKIKIMKTLNSLILKKRKLRRRLEGIFPSGKKALMLK